jgi:predicted TIM-barrel fold metal-dependent hydrolase
VAQLVDIHSHLYPRPYVDALKRRTELPRIVGDPGAERFVIFEGEHGRPMSSAYWELDEKLAFMDATGITQTVASLGNPWLDPFDAVAGGTLADEMNAYFAGLERATGGRIVGLGVLPQQDLAAAVHTVHEIAETPTLYGIVNGCRICGHELDAPELDSLWEALQERRRPLLIHPHYLVGADALGGHGHTLPVALGFPFETTVALARLVLAGVLQRFPALTIVAAHGGGALPFLAGRLTAAWRSDTAARERLQIPPSQELAKLFLDALVYHPGAMLAAAAVVGVQRMAFGTDHPFSVADPAANLLAIDQAFSDYDREAVRSRTARGLFGLPALDDDLLQPPPLTPELARGGEPA